MFIQQQMQINYNGTWVVSMFGGSGTNYTNITNTSDPTIGLNLGISSYSANG